jgi:hypothetical protein
LQRLLDAHPQLAMINETLWITREVNGPVTRELVSRLFEDRRFRRLDLPRDEVELLLDSEGSVPYARFVTGIFDLYGAKRGKRFVGDKSPGYVRRIGKLHALWPEAKFVHLIRDGRDVCLSIAKWRKADHSAGQFATWADDPIGTTALWWERSVRLGREAGVVLGPALYREVRYEELVESPARECRSLCSFLGIPYEEAMLRFHEGRTQRAPGLSAKKAWLPPTSGLRDWHVQMSSDDVERFEAAAGDLLAELGYPRVRRRLAARAGARAAQTRAEFTADARARRRRLPGAWRS